MKKQKVYWGSKYSVLLKKHIFVIKFEVSLKRVCVIQTLSILSHRGVWSNLTTRDAHCTNRRCVQWLETLPIGHCFCISYIFFMLKTKKKNKKLIKGQKRNIYSFNWKIHYLKHVMIVTRCLDALFVQTNYIRGSIPILYLLISHACINV